MTEKINPEALAEWGEEDGAAPEEVRSGVQPVDEEMIRQYVEDNNLLPTYSAVPFAAWLDEYWYQHSEPSSITNGEVISGALVDWCGGRPDPEGRIKNGQ